MTSVEELGMSLQHFGWPDYVVFVLMLLMCAGIGVYFGFCVGKTSTSEYLMGGRNMKTFPVSMSLIASFISGITLLGTPTELYVYGTQYMYILFGVIIMGLVMGNAFLPVFHDLKLTSTYEYLERRFNKKVRLFGSFLFTISILTWLPIVIYVPALAFNQVTGINVHVITPAVCLVCIFYTCVGGLKAVVWTDVIQTCIMFGSMLLVIVKGTIDIGGIGNVWERNFNSGRIEAPNFSANPFERHTFWVLVFGGCTHWLQNNAISQTQIQRYMSLKNLKSAKNFSTDPLERHTFLVLVVGGFFNWLQNNAISQTQIQRYMALRTLKSAKRAMWIFVLGCMALICICSYSGLLIFAKYYDCDPLTTKLAAAKDQLLPLLVMDTLGQFPGIPGLFVAGVFSAALSSLSTGLNSMAAVVLEDFYKPFSNRKLTDRQTDILMKAVVVILGFICVALVLIVEHLGAVLQMAISLGGITNGASLGIFCMGLFLPMTNYKGALAGGVAGLAFMSWICLGAQAAIAAGHITFPTKPVTVVGCTYNFTMPVPTSAPQEQFDVFPLYRISYLWYTVVGTSCTVLVGLLVSWATGGNDMRQVDPMVISPVVRRFLPKRNDKLNGVDNKIELSDEHVYKIEYETASSDKTLHNGDATKARNGT